MGVRESGQGLSKGKPGTRVAVLTRRAEIRVLGWELGPVWTLGSSPSSSGKHERMYHMIQWHSGMWSLGLSARGVPDP